ncbi:MAG: DUF4160 domain-containing protein, partial [Sulfuricellaceae bacterium]
MGKIYAGNGWLIKVFGNEHPPMHVHVVHPDGKALIHLDGTVRNRCVPIAVITQTIAWISANHEAIRAEWARLEYALRGENCPVGLPPAGALPRCKLLAWNDHAAQFAPCIASRWEQSNP